MTDSKDDRIRALEDEVKRLELMLESAPDFITHISVDGKFLYVNRLAPGFQLSDVLGTSVDKFVPPEFRERALQARAKARGNGHGCNSMQRSAARVSTAWGTTSRVSARCSKTVRSARW